MQQFNDLKALIASVEDDVEKFSSKGNKAAGTRIRKAMQDVKNLAQEIRVEVQNKKNEG